MGEIVETNWKEVRHLIKNIDSVFTELVEEINPSDDFPLFISSYEYGEKIGDNFGTILKDKSGNSFRLGDSSTPVNVKKHLGYGIKDSPLMMLLDKNFEWYIFDKNNNAYFPVYIEGPGFFVGTRQLITDLKKNTYLSGSLMCCTAGSRNAFMLPNIGNQKNHTIMQRALGITASVPKEMQEHWTVFKEIDRSTESPRWQAKILIFSEIWIDNLKNNPKWIYLQRHLIKKMINSWEHDKDSFFYNFAFSSANIQMNVIKNNYLIEIAKHLIGIALGSNIGFKPSTDNQSLPLHVLQKVYCEIYQLKNNPIIFEPTKFNISSENQLPVYYSLQRPIIGSFEKQTTTEPRALVNLYHLNRILLKYKEAFTDKRINNYYKDTSLQEIFEKIQFSYYHHAPSSSDDEIKSSSALYKEDIRFSIVSEELSHLSFPKDARFFRGCIKISRQ